jgi:hypothetical protein
MHSGEPAIRRWREGERPDGHAGLVRLRRQPGPRYPGEAGEGGASPARAAHPRRGRRIPGEAAEAAAGIGGKLRDRVGGEHPGDESPPYVRLYDPGMRRGRGGPRLPPRRGGPRAGAARGTSGRGGEGDLGQGPGTGHGAAAASRAVWGRPSRVGAGGQRFVAQKHGARSSRHDARLEADRGLTPWAVPKGRPSDPAEKVFATPAGGLPVADAAR